MNEYLARFREQYPQYGDMADAELAKALHEKFYADMSFADFAGRIGLAQNTGPTPQPAFPTLPPAVGGALDALVAFGNGAGAGLPALLSKNTRAYMGELNTRAPGASVAAQGAGALGSLGASLLATPARVPAAASAAFKAGVPLNPLAPSLATRAAPYMRPIAKWTGIGGGSLAGLVELRRMLGNLGSP